MEVIMNQELINWLLCGFGALLGFILKTLWEAVKDLQKADAALTKDVGEIKVLVAGNYVTRADFQQSISAMFSKLDVISAKLDGKADKGDHR
jgi:hypothetical protein